MPSRIDARPAEPVRRRQGARRRGGRGRARRDPRPVATGSTPTRSRRSRSIQAAAWVAECGRPPRVRGRAPGRQPGDGGPRRAWPAARGRTGRGSASSPSTTRCRASATAAATTRWRRRASARRSRSPASATAFAGEIVFLGTPPRSGGAARQIMIDDGLFEGLDAALLYHPCDRNHVDCAPLASEDVDGHLQRARSRTPSSDPWKGRNALDAMIALFVVGGPVAPAAAAATAASTGSSRRAAPPRTSSRTAPGPGS